MSLSKPDSPTNELVKSLVAREADLINKKKSKTKDKDGGKKKHHKKKDSVDETEPNTSQADNVTISEESPKGNVVEDAKAKQYIDSIIQQAHEEYQRANNAPVKRQNETLTSTSIKQEPQRLVKPPQAIQGTIPQMPGNKGFEKAYLSFLQANQNCYPGKVTKSPQVKTVQPKIKVETMPRTSLAQSFDSDTTVSLSPIKTQLSEISQSVLVKKTIVKSEPQFVGADLELFDQLQGNSSNHSTQNAQGFLYKSPGESQKVRMDGNLVEIKKKITFCKWDTLYTFLLCYLNHYLHLDTPKYLILILF